MQWYHLVILALIGFMIYDYYYPNNGILDKGMNQLESLTGMDLSPKISTQQERPTECALVYEPVCGANNETYLNGCDAQKSGMFDYTPGTCW